MLRVTVLKRSRGKCTSILQTASLRRRNKLGYCAVTNSVCRTVDRGTFYIMSVISRLPLTLMRRESDREPGVPSCHRLFPSSDRDQDPAGLPAKAQGDTVFRLARTSRKKVIGPPHPPATFSYREFQKHGGKRLGISHAVPIPQLPEI